MGSTPGNQEEEASQKPEDQRLDLELMEQAEKLVSDKCNYSEASHLLAKVQDKSLLKAKHHRILKATQEMQDMLKGQLSPSITLGEWKKQGESHKKYDFDIFYKVDQNYQLSVRMDVVLESSLLTPILSVFNESELYSLWMPRWKHPRTGFRKSQLLNEMGRGNQLVLVTVDMPFPIACRETVHHANAIDAIDEHDAIVIQVHSAKPGQDFEGAVVPEPDQGVVRVDFDCGMVIRSCPDNHGALNNSNKEYPADEPKLLLTIYQEVDPHIRFVPLTLVNFFTRNVIKQMLINLLEVADEVRSGQRAEHKAAIDGKPELYQWVEERVEVMCSKLS